MTAFVEMSIWFVFYDTFMDVMLIAVIYSSC